ncbi:unnamed protein product, partial [Musa hybrid cultivar]
TNSTVRTKFAQSLPLPHVYLFSPRQRSSRPKFSYKPQTKQRLCKDKKNRLTKWENGQRTIQEAAAQLYSCT